MIGTGLFLSSGSALAQAGPLGCVLGFVVVSEELKSALPTNTGSRMVPDHDDGCWTDTRKFQMSEMTLTHTHLILLFVVNHKRCVFGCKQRVIS